MKEHRNLPCEWVPEGVGTGKEHSRGKVSCSWGEDLAVGIHICKDRRILGGA